MIFRVFNFEVIEPAAMKATKIAEAMKSSEFSPFVEIAEVLVDLPLTTADLIIEAGRKFLANIYYR